MKIKDFHIPTEMSEAQSLLKQLGADGVIVAGATSHNFFPGGEPKVAVDITRLGLSGIRRDGDRFIIGATTTIHDLAAYGEDGWVLNRVALRYVTQQVRNISTLGGNIVRVLPWADFPVALLAMDAVMVIEGEGRRAIASEEFFASQPVRLFQPGDLLTEIHVPVRGDGEGFGYHKETCTAADFSRLTVAAWMMIEDGEIRDVCIAAGAGLPFPLRLKGVESELTGKKPSAAVFEQAAAQSASQNWKGAMGFSDEYIRHLAKARIVDVLTEAWNEAKGGAK